MYVPGIPDIYSIDQYPTSFTAFYYMLQNLHLSLYVLFIMFKMSCCKPCGTKRDKLENMQYAWENLPSKWKYQEVPLKTPVLIHVGFVASFSARLSLCLSSSYTAIGRIVGAPRVCRRVLVPPVFVSSTCCMAVWPHYGDNSIELYVNTWQGQESTTELLHVYIYIY